jgi:two-component system NtrC family sensor kinase
MSFRLKTVLGIAAIEVLLLAILVFSGLRYLRETNAEQLLDRAASTARLLATATADAVVATDLATLESILGQAMDNRGVRYIRVRNADGVELASAGEPTESGSAGEESTNVDPLARSRIDVSAPIEISGKRFGTVDVGVSTGEFRRAFDEARTRLSVIAATEIVLVALFGLLLGTILTRRLRLLRDGARRIAGGEAGYQVPLRGRDEIAETTAAFNRMSEAVADFSRNLEAKVADRTAELDTAMRSLSREVEERRVAEDLLRQEVDRSGLLAAVIEASPVGVTLGDVRQPDVPLTYCNSAFLNITGYDRSEVEGHNCRFLTGPETAPDTRDRLREAIARRTPVSVEILNYRKDGTQFWNLLTLFPVINSDGEVTHIVGMQNDVTERREAEAERARLQAMVLESNKLEALGTLAGGIAHEINTPAQYIGDNLRFVSGEVDGLFAAIEAAGDAGADGSENEDLDYLREEIPTALRQSIEGVEHIATIVKAIREFSHPGQRSRSQFSLNASIENTVTVSRNQWKYAADVELELDPAVPEIVGMQGEINQVLLNLITNAAQAIEERGDGARGTIRIATRPRGDGVELTIADTGGGIAPENLDRIFDLFFTTKPPGKGTGQGLAIAHAIVVKHHGGTIDVDSTPGTGTTFTITLPVTSE